MPPLRKRKAGHYSTFASRWNTMYRISPAGVEYLRREHGIFDDDNIPYTVLSILRERGWAYTDGGGTSFDLEEFRSGIAQWQEWLRLCLDENDVPCGLQLVFPELTTEHLAQVPGGNYVSVLDHCALHVGGVGSVSAAALWPGRGGGVLPVSPRETAYQARLDSRWPDFWPREPWTGECPGLHAPGTFFDAAGQRIRPGGSLFCGETYHLLIHWREVSNTLDKTKPYSVVAKKQPSLEQWELKTITLPPENDARVATWIKSLGYSLRERPWRLSIVSPLPLWRQDNGLPMLPKTEEVVLEALIPDGLDSPQLPSLLLQQENKPIVQYPRGREGAAPLVSGRQRRGKRSSAERRAFYLALPVAQPGRYQVRFVEPVSPVLSFAILDAPAEDSLDKVRGLTIYWTSGDAYVEVNALRDGVGPHEVPISRAQWPPALDIGCPVPLTLRLAIASKQPITCEGMADDIAMHLESELQRIAPTVQISVDIDAGSFGRCTFLLMPPAIQAPRPVEPTTVMPRTLLQRARWLSAVSVALPSRGSCPMAILPQAIIDALRLFDPYADLAKLRRNHVVPSVLLPQYASLAAALRCYQTGSTSH